MAMTDPVGDLLTRIRNGQSARLDSVTVPASKMRSNVLDVLQREGYIRGWFEEELRAGVKEIRIVRSEPLRIGGQPGHQVIAEAKDDPSATPVTMVQWLRFGPGRFLHVFGLARTEAWQSVFMRMRTLRDGIEPK